MKKSIVLLLMAVSAPFLVMAQNVDDDLYYVPSKTKKVQAKAAEQKTEAEAARKTVVVNSGTPSTTVVVPTGTQVVVKGNTKNKRSVDEYNRRYTGDATVSNRAAVISGETNYDEELDGEWVGGYEGNADDYEYATRIIRFRNPRFAISISSPYYWDVVYGLNSWEWNVFVDDYYAYVFPTWTNRLWFDWRFSTAGWGWGWSTWYHPWYTSWHSPWHFGWYGGWHPWHTGWYGGWYGGWHGPHHYYGWGGYHYRPQNYTFRGAPGARSNYSGVTRRGGNYGGNQVGVNNSSVRTRTGTTGTRVRTTGTRTTANGRVVSGTGTRVRTNSGSATRGSVNTNSTGTRVRGTSGTTINTRSGSTVRSSSGTNGTRSRTYSPSGTQNNRSYSPGSSSSTRVRSNSSTPTRSSSSTRSYSGGSSTRSYSGGGFSGGSTRSSGGGFSSGGGSSRGGGGGGGTRSR